MQFTLTEGKLRDKKINIIFVHDASAFKTNLQFMTLKVPFGGHREYIPLCLINFWVNTQRHSEGESVVF